MRKYLCREAGCKALINEPGYCGKHKREKKSGAAPFGNAARSNNSLYHTPRWRALAKKHLNGHPFCVCCGTDENLTADHIIPPRGDEGLFYDSGNLETLCLACHRWKTAREIAERKKY
jgi:5-methylcytosine-specific restriction protein A